MAGSRRPFDDPERSLVARLSERANGVDRRPMPDGGLIHTGRLVDRVLRELGGRAHGFTHDHRVFVPTTFDPSSTRDQAVYAHERWHAAHSGGAGGGRHGDQPDHEEHHARLAEEMVLQLLDAGTSLRDALDQLAQHEDAVPTALEPPIPGPASAYQRLRDQGWSHERIVSALTDHVITQLRETTLDQLDRTWGPRWRQ